MTPKWVAAILESRAFPWIARILLTTPFWAAGIQHLAQFQDTLGEMEHFALNPPLLWAVIAILSMYGGSILVIAGGRWTWLGAGWLGVFTVLTIPIAHAFWKLQSQDQIGELRTVMEHISIIGGMMVVAILEHRRAAPSA